MDLFRPHWASVHETGSTPVSPPGQGEVFNGRRTALLAKHGLLRAIGRINGYLRDGAASEVVQAILDLEPPRPQIIYEINSAYRKDLIGRIDGKVPKRLFVDVLAKIFREYGIEIGIWFVPEKQLQRQRAFDELQSVVRSAIGRATTDPDLRNSLQSEITEAIGRYSNAERAANTERQIG